MEEYQEEYIRFLEEHSFEGITDTVEAQKELDSLGIN